MLNKRNHPQNSVTYFLYWIQGYWERILVMRLVISALPAAKLPHPSVIQPAPLITLVTQKPTHDPLQNAEKIGLPESPSLIQAPCSFM
jgi:hypothetical protein